MKIASLCGTVIVLLPVCTPLLAGNPLSAQSGRDLQPGRASAR